MGKEMIISTGRHETRVAILEDDQLVEVYFQRTNEYSLAGSIHKGRVTRVLPGMQSAFVDVGLERDTFLYVSDFFEENEEYDRISADDRPARVDNRVERRPPPTAESAAPAETQPTAAAVPPASTAPTGDRPAGRNQENERDRFGRRSRRRRNRGGGFPEAKYASQTPPTRFVEERPEPAPEPVAEAVGGAEFSLLPGESLAKYTRASSEGFEPRYSESAAATAPAPEYREQPIEERYEEPEQITVVETQAPEPSVVETSLAAPIVAAPGFAEPSWAEPAAAVQDAPVAETETETLTPVAGNGEIAADSADEIAEQESESVAVDAGEPIDQNAAPPPGSSAGLREQGPNYQHRVARRGRRRGGRGGFEGPDRRPAAPVPVAERPAPAPRPERTASTSITELLKEGQEILVQIAKEPLGQKGARITSHIALPGRYCVYMPTVEHIGVSRKIASDEERQRLKRILLTHRAGMTGGFIVRTAGEGKPESEIAADIHFLYDLWLDIRQKAESRPAPALIHHDPEIVERILRDQLTEQFKAVWADTEEMYEGVVRFVQRFQPALVPRVKLYTRDTPIMDAFNVTAELEKALRPKVWLKSGGYIVINQTEALVAIDINTGKYVGKSNRLEDTIVKTNTEAIREIVRQIRLRDLGGIIVIDFIDMDERKNRQKVMQALEEAMQADRAPNKILQFNDFGLVAITRKRVKQSLERTLCSPCPYCEGSGYVKSVQTVLADILLEARKIVKAVEGKECLLRVHPDVGKVLKSSDNHHLEELEEILGRPVAVVSDALLHQEKFDLT